MPSDAANRWTEFYTKSTEMMYPAEAVIRIFKGTYPNLKMPRPKAGDFILDVGCGDGRHFPLFQQLGMRIAGSEITDEITQALIDRFGWRDFVLRASTCANLRWPDAAFDYLLTWNSCYYMEPEGKFEDHVAEMARVLKPGGWLICSVPKTGCFIFKDAKDEGRGYCTIQDDYFGLRNGQRMRWFEGVGELEEEFDDHFDNFCHASIDIDMFGLAYNWHVFTAERRT